MQFEIWTKALAELPIDCVAVGVHDDGELTPEARSSTCAAAKNSHGSLKRGDFGGQARETWLLTDLEGLRAERVLLVGLGAKARASKENWRARRGAAPSSAAISAATRTRVTSLALALPRPARQDSDRRTLGRAVAEIAGNTLYRVNDLKSGKKPRRTALARVVVVAHGQVGAGHPEGLLAGQRAGRRRRAHAQSRQPSRQRLHAYLPGQDGRGSGQDATNPCA